MQQDISSIVPYKPESRGKNFKCKGGNKDVMRHPYFEGL